jgi:hypothetical protein
MLGPADSRPSPFTSLLEIVWPPLSLPSVEATSSSIRNGPVAPAFRRSQSFLEHELHLRESQMLSTPFSSFVILCKSRVDGCCSGQSVFSIKKFRFRSLETIRVGAVIPEEFLPIDALSSLANLSSGLLFDPTANVGVD